MAEVVMGLVGEDASETSVEIRLTELSFGVSRDVWLDGDEDRGTSELVTGFESRRVADRSSARELLDVWPPSDASLRDRNGRTVFEVFEVARLSPSIGVVSERTTWWRSRMSKSSTVVCFEGGAGFVVLFVTLFELLELF
jgi:hypothetical protein